jgi:hypothetical protein
MIFCAASICFTFSRTTSPARRAIAEAEHDAGRLLATAKRRFCRCGNQSDGLAPSHVSPNTLTGIVSSALARRKGLAYSLGWPTWGRGAREQTNPTCAESTP